MRKTTWSGALAAVLVLAAPVAGQEDAAALVVRISGDVQVRHAGQTPTAASVGARLAAGDEVMPATGARALLITRGGATLNVTAPTTVPAPSGGGSSSMWDRAMSTLAQAAGSEARTSGGRQGMIRPIPGEPTLVAPRNGLLVSTSRPVFTWMPVEGATGYTIQLRRVDGGRPMRFATGNVTEWALPSDAADLEPGAEYAWTVAPDAGRPTREQRFRVVDDQTREDVSSTLEELSALGVDPEDDGLFLVAVVYRDLDLLYDALAALGRLEEVADGALAADLYLLKGEILNQVGRAEEATAAFDRADALMR